MAVIPFTLSWIIISYHLDIIFCYVICETNSLSSVLLFGRHDKHQCLLKAHPYNSRFVLMFLSEITWEHDLIQKAMNILSQSTVNTVCLLRYLFVLHIVFLFSNYTIIYNCFFSQRSLFVISFSLPSSSHSTRTFPLSDYFFCYNKFYLVQHLMNCLSKIPTILVTVR